MRALQFAIVFGEIAFTSRDLCANTPSNRTFVETSIIAKMSYHGEYPNEYIAQRGKIVLSLTGNLHSLVTSDLFAPDVCGISYLMILKYLKVIIYFYGFRQLIRSHLFRLW